jgi:hypothetical protein
MTRESSFFFPKQKSHKPIYNITYRTCYAKDFPLKLRAFTVNFSAAGPCEAKNRYLLLQSGSFAALDAAGGIAAGSGGGGGGSVANPQALLVIHATPRPNFLQAKRECNTQFYHSE